MVSTTPLSPSPRAQVYCSSLTPKPEPSSKSSKLYRKDSNLIFSTPELLKFTQKVPTFYFPHTLKLLPSLHTSLSPLHLQPLSDSTDDNFTESLEALTNLQTMPNRFASDVFDESSKRVFIQDPPLISALVMRSLYLKAKQKQGFRIKSQEMERWKYNLLRKRQVKAETEAWEDMVEEYRAFQREMCEKKLAPNLPYIKKLFLDWFEPLRASIEKEQKAERSKRNRAAYAPFIDCLPADKMAVIVMHKLMASLMSGGTEYRYVRVVEAAIQIGMTIENEVRIHSFLETTKRNQKANETYSKEGWSNSAVMLRKRIKSLMRRNRVTEVQKLVKGEKKFKPWDRATQAKLGCHLLELLTQTAYVLPPANQSADDPFDIRPAFRHLFKMTSKNPGEMFVKKYGVIECDPLVFAGLDKTAKHIMIPYVPMLVPPRKWKGYNKGGYMFLPSYLMRTHGFRQQQDAVVNVHHKQMRKVYEALDALGHTKWRVNKRILDVVESLWARGGNIAGLVAREDVPLPELESDDAKDVKKWRWSTWKARKVNQERHSQRCDTELKLSVARKMKDEEGFYYPHNLDFRGRVYAMHPHLNHLSSDLCRGILEFAEGRPLGKSGLRWLKIHLANVFAGGVEKLSYDERLAFVEDHLSDIFDSADNPVNGDRWWLQAEDPFQCLAACNNLSEALRSSSPHTVICHLPVHQDGSCNGLQHYAALGRNSMEAAAVNLVAGDKPADVYSEIAARVHDIMRRDSVKDSATNPRAVLAKLVVDQVDRKLVKQTVMTSVYGVTYIGAREQIKKRLQEKGLITDDRVLFRAACYAAKVTLAALGEIFEAARSIMGWLGDCAEVIAAENQSVRWTTPLGLPVLQPYYKTQRHIIRTSLQILALRRESNMVDRKKQRTAFPPNFVHSLDGTHIMMTAIACRDAGLCFAGVHDSFWTHAGDADKMNRILREKFVELYNMPILENLLESFETSYPGLDFPCLPQRGNFNLQEVLESPYFFN